MKTAKHLFALLSLLLLLSCEKGTIKHNTGRLKNLTGLDGCGWVIELDSSTPPKRLKPVNLQDFKITLADGQKVDFSYYETGDASICMVGPVIKIRRIKKN
jgi:hypothetical protein